MSVSQLINRACVILQRSGSGSIDDYGNQQTVDSQIDTVCEVQQQRRHEPGDAGELSVTEWVVFFPAGTDVRTGDAVAVDGFTYELVGDPWAARNPRTGSASHVEATARRTAGEGSGS